MTEDVLTGAKQDMEKTLGALRRELSHVRTGRASTSILEGITVDYYGAKTPLNQLATLSAPEPTLLVVTPFDKSVIGAIEKAIKASDLGLNPLNDGKIIRIPIPQLNEERRKLLVKNAHKHAEEGRVAIRNVRRDVNDHLKKMLKSHEVSEDDEKQAMAEVQKMTDQHIEQINETLKKKETEIMAV